MVCFVASSANAYRDAYLSGCIDGEDTAKCW